MDLTKDEDAQKLFERDIDSLTKSFRIIHGGNQFYLFI